MLVLFVDNKPHGAPFRLMTQMNCLLYHLLSEHVGTDAHSLQTSEHSYLELRRYTG